MPLGVVLTWEAIVPLYLAMLDPVALGAESGLWALVEHR